MAISRKDVQQARSAGIADLACPAFAVNPANGDTVVVFCSSWRGAGATTHSAPTDSQGGNTYTQIGTALLVGANIRLSEWRAENVTGAASFVVTGHHSSANTFTVVTWVLTGALTPTSYNGDTVSAATVSANPASGASTPAPAANSFFIAGASHDQGQNWLVAGSGWTFPTNAAQEDNTTFQALYTEQLTGDTSSSVQNGQFTGVSSTWAARVASFAPAGAGGAATAWRQLHRPFGAKPSGSRFPGR